ncbi:hypothetical protein [Rhodoferax sp.]|uniref:hypothetical protein n=1 Tax=Rhodoferax sp. TaxID=50421 RepID=UPI00374DF582
MTDNTPGHVLKNLDAGLSLEMGDEIAGHDEDAGGGLENDDEPVLEAVPAEPGLALVALAADDELATHGIGTLAATDGLGEVPAAGSLGLLLGVGDSWIRNIDPDTADFADALAALGYDTSSFKRTSGEGLTLRIQAAVPADVEQPGIYQELRYAIDAAAHDVSKRPKALLVSVSGNDIHATTDDVNGNTQPAPLAKIVLPAGSAAMINASELNKFIDVLKGELIVLLEKLLEFTKEDNYHIPVVLHGYDYPVPDGRNYQPVAPEDSWLYSVITHQCHYDGITEGRAIMTTLIYQLNVMMAGVASTYAAQHVIHAKLTGTLQAVNYKDDWMNELHPTNSGFVKLGNALRKFLPP